MTESSRGRVFGPLTQCTDPLETLLWRYRRYLSVERGLETRTAARYAEAVRPFLESRASAQGLELRQLSTADVTAFVVARCPHQPRGTAKMTVTALRSLLGFLHLEGAIPRPLVAAVPSVAGWRLAGLPKRLEPAQVRDLLRTCDRRTAKGRRDFAILSTAVRLGLRASELTGLELDDIDWRAGEVVVRGKGRRADQLPLPADVGEAIADYLREDRPTSAESRAVFVAVATPHRSLTRSGITWIVRDAARSAGLKQVSPHRLRHTAASEMIRAGASLPEVGQLLRHRRVMTTAIYAKVDREGLRRIARPWPGDVL